MTKAILSALLSALLALPVAAQAPTPFSQFIGTAPAPTTPFGSSDGIAMVQPAGAGYLTHKLSPQGIPFVNVRQYGVVGGGIIRKDGQIGAGSSTGTCDLYSVGYNFGAASPSPIGHYAVVYGAGA